MTLNPDVKPIWTTHLSRWLHTSTTQSLALNRRGSPSVACLSWVTCVGFFYQWGPRLCFKTALGKSLQVFPSELMLNAAMSWCMWWWPCDSPPRSAPTNAPSWLCQHALHWTSFVLTCILHPPQWFVSTCRESMNLRRGEQPRFVVTGEDSTSLAYPWSPVKYQTLYSTNFFVSVLPERHFLLLFT